MSQNTALALIGLLSDSLHASDTDVTIGGDMSESCAGTGRDAGDSAANKARRCIHAHGGPEMDVSR